MEPNNDIGTNGGRALILDAGRMVAVLAGCRSGADVFLGRLDFTATSEGEALKALLCRQAQLAEDQCLIHVDEIDRAVEAMGLKLIFNQTSFDVRMMAVAPEPPWEAKVWCLKTRPA